MSVKTLPGRVCFTEAAFCELLEEALKRDVLAYGSSAFSVTSVTCSIQSGANEWQVTLAVRPPEVNP